MSKKLPETEIVFLKGESNYTNIHFEDGSKLLISYTLKKVMAHFPESPVFIRIHRTYAINTQYIENKIENTEGHFLRLKNGVVLPVSRRKREQLIKFL